MGAWSMARVLRQRIECFCYVHLMAAWSMARVLRQRIECFCYAHLMGAWSMARVLRQRIECFCYAHLMGAWSMARVLRQRIECFYYAHLMGCSVLCVGCVVCLCCGVGSQLKFKVSEKNVLACAFCVCLCPQTLEYFFHSMCLHA